MSEVAGIIIAVVGLFGCLGGGIKFIWSKIERRFLLIETDLRECHSKHEISLERRAKQLTVIELLWAELQRIAPKSPVFERVKKLLDDLKPMDGE